MKNKDGNIFKIFKYPMVSMKMEIKPIKKVHNRKKDGKSFHSLKLQVTMLNIVAFYKDTFKKTYSNTTKTFLVDHQNYYATHADRRNVINFKIRW